MNDIGEYSIRYTMEHMQSVDDGRHPTREEAIGMIRRAMEIASSPYSSPEKLMWACEVYPEVLNIPYPLKPHKKGIE